jgi:hypothetical protein
LTGAAHILYKVVEVAPVTEETVERTLNDRAREGWGFESLHFVMREGSHRPAMAYLFFTRVREDLRAQGQLDEAAPERAAELGGHDHA